jgi:hypothetical protein
VLVVLLRERIIFDTNPSQVKGRLLNAVTTTADPSMRPAFDDSLLFFLEVATTIDVLESLRPTDVIYQRDNLLAWWSIPGAAQRMSALQGRRPLPGWENYDTSGEIARQWMESAIRDAHLYWVSPEMTEVIETLAPSIPDCYPQPPVPNGFVMFAKSVAGTDAANGKPILTTAILWDHNILATAGDCLCLETYAWRDLVTDYTDLSDDDKAAVQRSMPTRLFPTGGSEWPVRELTTEFKLLPADDATKRLSIIEDRKLMSTFWALCSQKIVEESVQLPTRAQRREAQRRGHREPSSVRVIRLREVARHGTGASRDVAWSHRWIVGSHWRNQWYPSTGSHRPKLIEAYQKGPADKPLKVRQTVRALVR